MTNYEITDTNDANIIISSLVRHVRCCILGWSQYIYLLI